MGFKYPLNPYGGLMTFPVAMAGGLTDSKAIPQAGDLGTLFNFVVFRNRFAVRAPVIATVQLLDDQGSPQPVTSVLSIRYHKNKMYVLAFSSITNKTYLYRLNPDGTAETPGPTSTSVAVVWTGGALPVPLMVSFDGGTPIAPVSRLFICDTSGSYDTMFWNSDANTINNVIDHFDDNVTARNSRYTYIWNYQYAMWGSGYYQTGVIRPEMIRFSQPGLIHAVEPDVVNQDDGAGREWWSVDHREIGARGDSVVAVGFAGGTSIIFKRRSCYALFGYDAETWTVRLISDKVGAVGPYAVTSTEDGLCFFWSDRGPHLTDGQTVMDIGGNIRKLVQGVGFNTSIASEYSVDDSIVYYTVPQSGSGTPNLYLAYQRQVAPGGNPQQPSSPGPIGLWSSGQWLNVTGSPMLVSMLAAVPNQVLPGPSAGPTNLNAFANAIPTQIDLVWTNGDTAQDTQTEIHRSLISGFTPGAGTLIATVGSGVATYSDTGLTPGVTYYYIVRHIRNGQYSANSNQASQTAGAKIADDTEGLYRFLASTRVNLPLFPFYNSLGDHELL